MKRPPQISAEEAAKRRPLPPAILLAAVADNVKIPPGRLIKSTPIRKPKR